MRRPTRSVLTEGSFENSRETETKTNSLVDRLQAIELPAVDEVTDDQENYLRTVEHLHDVVV